MRSSSLVAIQPAGSSTPFFCVPGIGGVAFYLQALAHHLGPDQPFYGLQPVGLDGESAAHTRIEDMAAHYIEEVKHVQANGPYLVGGHSFGALVAYEMAKQLLEYGDEVAQLVILDALAPKGATQSARDDEDEVAVMLAIAEQLERFFGKDLGITAAALRGLGPDERPHYLQQRLVAAGVIPAGRGMRQVHGLIQIPLIHSRIRYVPRRVQVPRITVFRANDLGLRDFIVSKVISAAGGGPDASFGWDLFSAAPVRVQVVPGDHYTMMDEPHVQALAKHLGDCLKQACDTEDRGAANAAR